MVSRVGRQCAIDVSESVVMTWICLQCSETHEDLPLCYGAEAPQIYRSIPESERAARVELSCDMCVIDRQYFLCRVGSATPFRAL